MALRSASCEARSGPRNLDEHARTRSEYRLNLLANPPAKYQPSGEWSVAAANDIDRGLLAKHLLDAYRGTIDDEGEGLSEALQVADHYMTELLPDYSTCIWVEGELSSICFVVIVGGRHYIDPVATASRMKMRGLGRVAVSRSLGLLRKAGIAEVGAVITDANEPSERLFTSLGFRRIGFWG